MIPSGFAKEILVSREWAEAVIIFVLALIGIVILKEFLHRVSRRRNLGFMGELIGPILNFSYVIALDILLHEAPLSPKAALLSEHVMYVLIVWVLMILIRRALLSTAEWSMRRTEESAMFQHGFLPLLKNLATLFVFATGGIMVFKHFGYDVMSLLTALGVGSLAVGLAAKEALSNMISGFVLIMDGNVHPGDRINLGTVTGDVEEIGLRSTKITTGDGNVMIVPNFDLVNNRILNLSMPSRAGTCSTTIRVPYTADFEGVKEICLRILDGVSKVDRDRGKWVNLNSLANGYQEIGIGWWLRDVDDQGDALTQFNGRLLHELDKKKIALIDAGSLIRTGSPS